MELSIVIPGELKLYMSLKFNSNYPLQKIKTVTVIVM